MKLSIYIRTVASLAFILLIVNCRSRHEADNVPDLKDVAYEAFIYTYPMMEQVKTVNGMFEFMGLVPNVVNMNEKYPMENESKS